MFVVERQEWELSPVRQSPGLSLVSSIVGQSIRVTRSRMVFEKGEFMQQPSIEV